MKIGNIIIVIGIVIILFGVFSNIFGRLGLPGDIKYQRGNFTFFFPIVTSIILSIILSFLLNLFSRGK